MALNRIQFDRSALVLSALVCLCAGTFGACRSRSDAVEPIRVPINQPPVTLHPRRSIDGIGQRLGALVFGALTRIGPDLEVQNGQAAAWSRSKDGLSWTFTLKP